MGHVNMIVYTCSYIRRYMSLSLLTSSSLLFTSLPPGLSLFTQDIKVDVVALINDTTGTQMALGLSDPDCFVGLILGKSAESFGVECMPYSGEMLHKKICDFIQNQRFCG